MTGAAAALSAAYVTAAGRLLGPIEYGSLVTLLALVSLVSLALAPLETGVAKLVAEYHGERSPGRALGLMRTASQRSLLWFAGSALLCLPILPFARRALNLSSSLDLVVLLAYLGASVWMSVLRGVLRGDHRFVAVGVTLVVESGARFAIGILAMALGSGAAGGMAGYLAGMALADGLAAWQLRDLRRHEPLATDVNRLAAVSGSLFFLFLYFQVLQSLDMVVAKRTLAAADAGYYAACSTLARLIIVSASPLLNVLFTRVSSLHAMGRPVARLVGISLGVSALLLLLGCLVPWLAGDLLLRLLFGESFRGDPSILRLMWLSASLLLLQQLCAFSLIAANRARGAWSLCLPCVWFAGLLFRYHEDGVQVAACGLSAALSGVVALAFMAWSSARVAANRS